MDATDKKKWVDALRSGKFKQTKGRLYDVNTGGYCCLGVACKIFKSKGKEWEDGWKGSLPDDMQKRLGLDSHGTIPKLPKKYRQRTLMALNDADVSFNALADIIEKYL